MQTHGTTEIGGTLELAETAGTAAGDARTAQKPGTCVIGDTKHPTKTGRIRETAKLAGTALAARPGTTAEDRWAGREGGDGRGP